MLEADGWWGSVDETPLQLLARMNALPADRAEIIPVRHPRMLHPDAVRDLEAAAPHDAGDPMALVRKLSHHAYAGSLQWPVGTGPLEAVYQRVSQNVVNLEQAVLLAAMVGARGDLIAPYARAVGGFAVRHAHEGLGETAVQLATILVGAARAAASGTDRLAGWTAWRWAIDAYVEVARASLAVIPDDRLFWTARELADEALAWGRVAGAHEERRAWSLLGRFLLDPYASNKHLERYEIEYDAWQARRRPDPIGVSPAERPHARSCRRAA